MLANFQMQYSNTNFLTTSNTPSSNFPPISPGGGSNVTLLGNSASASATNQSNPPTPTSIDQNATTSPVRKASKKVMILFLLLHTSKAGTFLCYGTLTLIKH